MFLQTILRFISSHRLLSKEGKYLVALSGGPDSVALLRVLKSLGYTIEAAHCNFHLRGAESDRDEAFCKSLCERLAIPFHVVHFDTVTYAQLHKVSIEMAARNLRYHWFAQLCQDLDASGICVAHHQDDQVETVLLNLLRGTGLKGLTGMKAKAKLTDLSAPSASASSVSAQALAPSASIQASAQAPSVDAHPLLLRPLLCVNEAQILAYLKSLGQDYVIDSTNLEDDVQRNKLRLDIIPLLEKVTPAASRNIIRMTENLRDIQAIVDDSLQGAAEAAASTPLPLAPFTTYAKDKLAAYISPKTLLWHILSPFGFNRPQVEEVAACVSAKGSGSTKEWRSHSHIAILTRDLLYLVDRQWWEQPLPTIRIPEPGVYRYGSSLQPGVYRYGSSLQPGNEPLRLRVAEQEITGSFSIPKDSHHIAVDATKVSFPLTLRPAEDGDRFRPFGMHGTKLVSDYLKDRKRSIIDRHRQLVLTASTGTIIWLVGECISDTCKVKLISGTSKVTMNSKGSSQEAPPTTSILLISLE